MCVEDHRQCPFTPNRRVAGPSDLSRSQTPETSIVTTASQNEAEESVESEEETAGERTTKVGRTRGGMKVAARIAAPSELLHGRRVGGSLHAGPHSLRPRVVAQVNAADSCLRIRRRRGAGGVFITVEPLAPCSLDTRPKVVARWFCFPVLVFADRVRTFRPRSADRTPSGVLPYRLALDTALVAAPRSLASRATRDPDLSPHRPSPSET